MVKTSPSPPILPELRDVVPESDIFLLFGTGFFLYSSNLHLYRHHFPPCSRLGAVSKHLRQPPAPPFAQYSESIKFLVELTLLYDVAALTPY